MARQEKYFIRFSDIHGVVYRASIQVEGFTGTATQLTASDNPIQMNEDNNNDPFMPVRTWSGYLRIVCTFAKLLEVLPTSFTSHKILITRGTQTTPFWIGYLKPESYNVKFSSIADEYEIPMVCALGVLDSISYEPSMGNITFAGGISDILGMSFAAGDVRYVIATTIAKYENQIGDLTSFLNTYTFFKVNDKYDPQKGETFDNGRLESDYTCLKALKQMCVFWGWSLRYYEGDIYLTAPDLMLEAQATPLRFQWEDFPTVEDGVQNAWTTDDFTSEKFVSRNAQLNILSPARKVMVEVIDKEDEPVEYPLPKLPYQTQIQTHTNGDYTHAKNLVEGTTASAISGDNICWQIDQNGTVTRTTFSPAQLDISIADGGIFGVRMWYFQVYNSGDEHIDAAYTPPCRLDAWKTVDTPEHTKYDWKYYLPIGYYQVYTSSIQYHYDILPVARLYTKYKTSFAPVEMRLRAEVYLSASWFTNESDYYNGNQWTYDGSGNVIGVNYSKIRAVIRCGNQYWNGTSWQSAFPSNPVLIPFGDPIKARKVINDGEDPANNLDGKGELVKGNSARIEDDKGYRITMPAHMTDVDVEITFYAKGPDDTYRYDAPTIIWISEPKLEYPQKEETEKKDICYEGYTGTASDSEKSLESLFHINLEGAGVTTTVLDPQGGFAGNYVYSLSGGEGPDDPLSVLCTRMKKFYQRSRIARKFEYVDDESITPIDFVEFSQDGEYHMPISYAYDLKNARKTIKTINIADIPQ